MLGRVYEYFLSQFASAEGKKGGEFYAPRCVVKLLVEMLEPHRHLYEAVAGCLSVDLEPLISTKTISGERTHAVRRV